VPIVTVIRACIPFLLLLGVALLVITRWPALATAPLGG